MKETPKEEALGYQVIHEEKEGDDGTIQKTTEIKNSHVTQVLFDGAETSANEARSDSGDASTIIIPTSKEDNHVIGL